MTKKKFLIIAVILSILAIFFVIFFYLRSKPSEQVGTNNNPDFPNDSGDIGFLERQNLGYPFWVAEEKGYFKEAGINQTFRGLTPDDKTDFTTWARGNIDVGILSLDELLAIEGKYPNSFKVIFLVADSGTKYATNIIVKKGSAIKSIKNLSGKKLAVATEMENFLLAKYLEENDVKDFQVNKFSRDDFSKALKSGTVDAVWVTEPYATKIVLEGSGEVLIKNPNNNPKTTLSQSPYTAIVVSRDFFSKAPTKVDALESALKKALALDDKEQREIMKKHLGKEWESVVASRTFAMINSADTTDSSLLQELADKMKEGGYLDGTVRAQNLF